MTLIKTTVALSAALFLVSAPFASADEVGKPIGGAHHMQMKRSAKIMSGRSTYAPKKNDSMSKVAGPAISKTGGSVPK